MDRKRETDDERVELSGLVYGVRLRGRLLPSFQPYLAPETAAADEPVDCLRASYRTLDELPEVEEIWASETGWPAGEGRFALFRLPGGFGLTVSAEGRGVFRCTPRALQVEWGPGSGAAHHFFTYALPLWLETEGVPVLHGSAVSLKGRAVGFVGPSGVGKSVLCAELLRLGCGFVADDGLALRRDDRGTWRCAVGPPLLRLWPSGLEERLGLAADGIPRVHRALEKRRLLLERGGAAFRAAGPPLEAIYVLRRRPGTEGPVTISACSGRDALVRLIEHGIAGGPAAALSLSAGRLERLADVAECVPVRLFSYPSGTETAARILEAIARDLDVRG